jgi:beta-glucanase (GH16 family)
MRTHRYERRGRFVAITLAASALALAGAPSCGRTQAMPLSNRQQLVFSDTFTGNSLNTSKWGTCYPWFSTTGCTNEGNQELEWYLPEQVTVGGGALHLTALRRPVAGVDALGREKVFDYRSGMVTTAGHFQLTYGRIEFKVRAPRGRGLWPALWLLPVDGSSLPEVDIMEAYGEDPWQVALTYHGSLSFVPAQAVFVNDISSGWHTYALDWSRSALTWFVDGHQAFVVDHGVPQKPMYLLADLAVSGSSPHSADATTPGTARLDIASIRVWA